MRILITGGCGYLGCSIIDNLLLCNESEEIVIYDNRYRKNPSFFLGRKVPNPNKVTFIEGDILDTYTLEKALKNIEVVIHLAAKASTPFAETTGHEFDQVNNWGTSIVTNSIEKFESVKKVIYLSTIAVYGDTKGKMVNEDAITAPGSFYGISKLKGEKHIQRLSDKNETYIFRLGNVFGYNPCIRLDGVVNKFLFEAEVKGKIEIHGDGEQKRAFTSVDCLGHYIANKVLLQKHETGLFNLVNYNLSINEIADKVKALYPNLDVMYLDQHLAMRSLTVESKDNLDFRDCFQSLDFHLQTLKHQFIF